MTISEIEAAERAEFIQSVKALLIPVCLFLACVIMAGGVFLIYSHYALGWIFVVVSVSMVLTSMVAFIRFQNKYRAKGILPRFLAEDDTIDDKPTATGTNESAAEEPLNSEQFHPDNSEVARIAETKSPQPLSQSSQK